MRILTWSLVAAAFACGEPEARPLPNDDPSAANSTAASQAPELSAVPDSADARPSVLIVGTSLTAGLGLDPQDAYPAVLQRMADSAGYRVNVVAAGVSGETSAGALRRVDWLLQRRADVIVIETGANDGLRGLDVDSTRANLREILRRSAAARPGARLFLVQMEAPPNLGPRYTSDFRAMFPVAAREAGASLVPFLLDSVAGVVEMNQSDGIHPNERGSVVVAANVWRALEPILRDYSRRRQP
ncbi:MAG: arylesterase [Gemmatimonadaceae bacterium]